MSEPKHTPGPWSVDTTVALGAYGVWTACPHPKNPGHDGSGYQVQICSVTVPEKTWFKADSIISKAERNANADLIAAAPALLAACKLWDEGFVDGEIFDAEQFRNWVNANRRAARAAIALAEVMK